MSPHHHIYLFTVPVGGKSITKWHNGEQFGRTRVCCPQHHQSVSHPTSQSAQWGRTGWSLYVTQQRMSSLFKGPLGGDDPQQRAYIRVCRFGRKSLLEWFHDNATVVVVGQMGCFLSVYYNQWEYYIICNGFLMASLSEWDNKTKLDWRRTDLRWKHLLLGFVMLIAFWMISSDDITQNANEWMVMMMIAVTSMQIRRFFVMELLKQQFLDK